VSGAVQGVGFRPFVYRLAMAEALSGFVRNTAGGAEIEIEGPASALARFLRRIDAEIAPPGVIRRQRVRRLAMRGDDGFTIAPSAEAGARSTIVLPDLAPCEECRNDIFDPANRRYLYPFTTCARCGPRYSIVAALPYDRARTGMTRFVMCASCRAEYEDPASRRFHAETIACPQCGPQLRLWDREGTTRGLGHPALIEAAAALRQGRIVAVKSVGGFQLLVDARNEAAVRTLRARKRRPAKPFALMVASLDAARAIASIASEEETLLASAAAPITLLRARLGSVAPTVAPDNPLLGVMLPSSPLHHLLLAELGFPVVATSGNHHDEPIVIDESEVVTALGEVADLFLVHDRPILHRVDDSVVRVIAGQETLLRRARGYAPLSLRCPMTANPSIALGAHQKNAIALAFGDQIVLGPHIGDLDTAATRDIFAHSVAAMTTLYDVRPATAACDRHPDYHTTRYADGLRLPLHRVPHHLAHVLAGMADNELKAPVLGIAWDGTGYGSDGTIWGGEFLALETTRFRRAAHFLPFRLPGGDKAMREPSRAALGVLQTSLGNAALSIEDLAPVARFSPAERRVLGAMLERGVRSPLTSSVGRLFDAVAAILGLCQTASFEGEAAMALEFAAEKAARVAPLPPITVIEKEGVLLLDWRPLIAALTDASLSGVPAPALAGGFHNALVEAIVTVALRLGRERVLLTGGCFQNALLTAQATARLRQAGFQPYHHRQIPPNDGGLAVGQAVFAARPLIEEKA
jgi:hydrogenase maturation protein HypF